MPRHLAGMILLPPPRALALLLVAVVAALHGWTTVQPAGAHGQLLSSQPADGSLVEVMPSRAYLTFSDAVSEVREIAVVGPDGSVTNGEATSHGAEVRQALWAGPDGDYTMSYFVVSADGHDIRGEVRFEVDDLAIDVPDPDAATTPAPTRSAEEVDGGGPGIALPLIVVSLSAAVALALLGRRGSTRSG